MSISEGLTITDKGRWRLGWVILALFAASGVAMAQGLPGQRHHQRPNMLGGRQGQGPRNKRGREARRHPPAFYKRLRELPPEEQERVLANDERFQKLPLEQQKEIRERLQNWNSLSPEEQERIRVRQEIVSNLTPTQREHARALFQEWRQVDPARRHELRDTFIRMRKLPPTERLQFLSSQEITQRFTPEERRLLEGLSRLLPDARGEAPAKPQD